MPNTVFGDLRHGAIAVYRVTTQSHVYIIGIHVDADGSRRYAIVRGEAGSERENLVLRDTDPRVGDRSLFDVPLADWVGQTLQVVTMTSSTIAAAIEETDPRAIAAVSSVPPGGLPVAWGPPPAGMSATPAIVQVGGKGTHPGAAGVAASSLASTPAAAAAVAAAAAGGVHNLARDVVAGAHRAELPYPQRHVRHAEDAAALLRSVARRDRIFEDAAFHRDRELLVRLRKALEECTRLAALIRQRDVTR